MSEQQYVGGDAGAAPPLDADLARPVDAVAAFLDGAGPSSARERARLDDLLDGIESAVYAFDHEWRLVLANDAARQALAARGIPVQGAIGRPVWELFPAAEGSPIAVAMRRCAAERVAVTIEERGPYSRRWLELRLAPIGGGVAVYVHDVSARRQAELRQRVLAEAGAVLSSSLDYATTIASVAKLVLPDLADYCHVDLVDPESGEIRRVATAHVDPAMQHILDEVAHRYPPGTIPRHPTMRAIRTGETVLIGELSREILDELTGDPEHRAFARDVGIRSLVTAPLRARGRVIGAITLVATATSGRRYEADDVAVVEELARRVALAVDNARLFRDSEHARARAERAAERIARLQRVTAALAGASSTTEVARAMLDHGLAAVGATAGVVCQLDADATEIEHVWALGYPQEGLENFRRAALAVALPPRDVVRTRAPVFVESPQDWLARFLPPVPGMAPAPAAAGLPLLVGERLVGVMVLRFPAPRTFTDDDRAQAMSVASQCAQALERARLHEAERAARARADDANRAKTEFLAVMSHELRTPLNAIAGYADLLELGVHGALSPEQREAVTRIQRSQRHLLGLINDVLSFARIDAGHVELRLDTMPVHETLLALEALVAPQVRAKAQRYVYEPCDPSLAARADAEKVRQILVNLLSNATKFTAAEGRISVSARGEGAHVHIRVADTGRGIPPDKLERIFEPFVQLDTGRTRAHEGTGLGLAISRDLARAMAGDILVESVEEQGSTFTVVLPIA